MSSRTDSKTAATASAALHQYMKPNVNGRDAAHSIESPDPEAESGTPPDPDDAAAVSRGPTHAPVPQPGPRRPRAAVQRCPELEYDAALRCARAAGHRGPHRMRPLRSAVRKPRW
ncbi:hypothetical protein GCM10027059_50690 [Myceligenerans halotolerans]